MAEEQEKISASEKKKEDWMNSKWRPMMGWMYMAVCTCDFMLFPILWSLLQSLSHGTINSQWQPLTLQGAGLFHIAMGAVLGIAAYGRTQEKLGGANNGGLGSGTTYVPPSTLPASGVINNGGFNVPSNSSTSFSTSVANTGNSFDTLPTSITGSTSIGTSSFGSSSGFGDNTQTSVSPTAIKPLVKRPGI